MKIGGGRPCRRGLVPSRADERRRRNDEPEPAAEPKKRQSSLERVFFKHEAFHCLLINVGGGSKGECAYVCVYK